MDKHLHLLLSTTLPNWPSGTEYRILKYLLLSPSNFYFRAFNCLGLFTLHYQSSVLPPTLRLLLTRCGPLLWDKNPLCSPILLIDRDLDGGKGFNIILTNFAQSYGFYILLTLSSDRL